VGSGPHGLNTKSARLPRGGVRAARKRGKAATCAGAAAGGQRLLLRLELRLELPALGLELLRLLELLFFELLALGLALLLPEALLLLRVLLLLVSPASVRSLFTVRAAISAARPFWPRSS
jgi:hypothetical protein